ncbi:hypothetical protein UMM65_15920 [Aureibaculum sp. 2210JD6-5]|uniref:hypothetical protein n=1 Tax=Aureibaculum sp. 2210JD6-5 TaxID=3103957 RepID=UPI002AAEDA01|nr:hypothetical protein [Aureibaculum sp. 2210JD6-5]MDY7396736.1 hypothetical protein [Aureibaculum sp. 2210JD6-5]
MENLYNILLIDDHPCVLEYYDLILNKISQNNFELNFNIDKAFDYYEGIDKIKQASLNKGRHIIVLDMRLGKSPEGKVLFGEDLGLLAKQLIPNVKIIISTFYDDAFKINSIIHKLNPLSLLIKNDFDKDIFENAIKSVVEGNPYYCNKVNRILQKKNELDYILDEIDLKILYELSIGTKITFLPDIVNMSMSGIEKRRRKLKDIFRVKSKNDRQLVLIAKEKGFI